MQLSKELGRQAAWRLSRISADDARNLATGKAAMLRQTADGALVTSVEQDLDTFEILAACGATRELPSRISVSLDDAIGALLARYATILVEGPRGGWRLVREGRATVQHAASTPLPIRTDAIVGAYPDHRHWDVLVWQPGMTRPRFVALDAALPTGIGTSALPVLLLRALRPSGAWTYLAYNVRAECFDGGWDHGSREGRAIRARFGRALQSVGIASLSSDPAPPAGPLGRRPALVRLQRRLERSFGSALVVDSRHTAQEARIFTGAAAARLSALSRLYGEPSGRRDMVVVVDGEIRNQKRHVTMLAERAGMLVAMREALA